MTPAAFRKAWTLKVAARSRSSQKAISLSAVDGIHLSIFACSGRFVEAFAAPILEYSGVQGPIVLESSSEKHANDKD